jgi:tripartite ATP-independent transporter DctM subunit
MFPVSIGLLFKFAFLLLGVPIAFGLVSIGFVGFGVLQGWGPALAMVGQLTFSTVLNEEMSVIPLFILMGAFISMARLSDELYDAANAMLGHFRGGLAMATVLACAGFSSLSGSSLATAATMSKVALPPMQRFGYATSLSSASIVAGATLDIMIPPSVPLILYGIMTRTDISALFIAGLLPGLLGTLLYLCSIYYITWRNPAAGPRGERTSWRQRTRALARIWGVAALFLFIIGGLYFGAFTPTEAAGMGAFIAFLFALFRRSMTWRKLWDVLLDAAKTTASILFLLIGALVFSNFIDIAGAPRQLAGWIKAAELTPTQVIFLMIGVYLLLGCILESMSMLFLTVPLFYPIVAGMGYDLVWFGIIVVTMIEISLIMPPLGLNVFVLHSVNPEIPTRTIFRGVIPFVAADIVRVTLLVIFPGIALFLPRMMG